MFRGFSILDAKPKALNNILKGRLTLYLKIAPSYSH